MNNIFEPFGSAVLRLIKQLDGVALIAGTQGRLNLTDEIS